MTGFVSVSPLVHRVLVLLGFVGLLSQSILVYFLEPLPRFQPLCRKILEGNILTLLILLESDLIMDIRLDRVEPYGAFSGWSWGSASWSWPCSSEKKKSAVRPCAWPLR